MGLDVTGGLAEQVAKLPAEMQPILSALMDRIAALEAQTAKDTEAIADKVIAALVPQLQALTQTANAVAGEAMAIIRRIDGAAVTVKLGPEA